MKTKDFIKMLQKADPTGEGYIRLPDGFPFACEMKAGYWDGPYSFLDEEGNLVYSTKHYKVDIYTKDLYDFVENNYCHFIPEKKTWEYIKSKVKFEFTYSIDSQRKEREESILKNIEEEYNNCVSVHENIWQKQLADTLKNADNGWTWFQNKKVDKEEKPNEHMCYTWKIYDKEGKDQGSSGYNTLAVVFSGLFERLDNDKKPGYYEWILKK